MKKGIQAFLQNILGFKNYLFIFSLFKIYTLPWDGPEREGDFNYFLSLLEEDQYVLDIGANIGIMSVLLAQKCKKGQVFAFEPVPENLHCLQRVKRFFKLNNLSIHPIALGTEEGELQMQMPLIKGVRMQGLSYVTHESIVGYSGKSISYTVKQDALDSLHFLDGLSISAIKMDVENYEQYVLRGGIELLRKNRPLIYCELWENDNRTACFDILRGLDYEFYVLFEEKLVPFQKGLHKHHNFFMIPKERTKDFF